MANQEAQKVSIMEEEGGSVEGSECERKRAWEGGRIGGSVGGSEGVWEGGE